MKKVSKKEIDKNEEIMETAREEIVSMMINKRYVESQELADILISFPGSTYEELQLLSTDCELCVDRKIAWLESEGLIYFDGQYYYMEFDEE